MDSLQKQLDEVTKDIKAAEAQLSQPLSAEDKIYWRKKEEQLRKKEEQLRKKEEQLQEKELILLRQQQPAGILFWLLRCLLVVFLFYFLVQQCLFLSGRETKKECQTKRIDCVSSFPFSLIFWLFSWLFSWLFIGSFFWLG
eukprot:Lithocolla_globosa_v1_NODE_58_length_7390_cov_243.140014.p5 type:complete len:141 gc:universal NODE_58_length_7390_cov_243.140014:2650-3072(+)